MTEDKKPANPIVKLEEEVLTFWDRAKIFEQSVKRAAPQGDYVFYDGPPFATGLPHHGHIVGSIMKDVVPRFWTMKGFRVERKWGWDCHGLPIENIAEKELGFKRKKDIIEYGVDKFNEFCRSKVLSYVEDWKVIIRRLGRWADMDRDYKTMDLSFMESVWWVFKQLWDKGLIYESYRSIHICPRCETTLSQQEVTEGYKDGVKDLSAIVKFELIDEPGIYVLAWTTTPWTLIANVALAVGESIEYVVARCGDERYIVAKDRIAEILKNQDYKIEKEILGKELVGKRYKPLFEYYSDKNEEILNHKVELGSQPAEVVVLCAIHNNKILLGHRMYTKDRPEIGKDFWIAPGGKVEIGETIDGAIKRELQEECNITNYQITKYLGTYPGYEMDNIIRCFLLEINDDIDQIKNNEPEKFNEWKFFGSAELPVAEFPDPEDDEKFFNDAIKWHNGFKIYGGDFVTTEDGTGIVHVAPAFGEDDLNLGKEKNLPFIQHLGMDGVIRAEAKDFTGLHVKPIDDVQATDKKIVEWLDQNHKLFKEEQYEHNYPHCWRCETPLLNYVTTSWFVNVLKIKDRAIELAKEINWSPAHVKEGRWGKWLEGARDWSISRQRFWASVMPMWKCEQCGELKVFGSVKELEGASGKTVTDLHKHVVDKITVPCAKCQGAMLRIPDVLDTWFDSGSMPYAQMHYPFENKEKFEATFPAEFIAEGPDQTRAWFYYLHVLATATQDKPAFKNVIVNGIVLAEDGKKMAKRLHNYTDPAVILEQYGADALRYYLLSSSVMMIEDLNFSDQGVVEALRKNLMVLWNVYKFYEMYAGSNQQAAINNQQNSTNILDRWILAKLNQLIKEVTAQMESYDLPRSVRPISDFINDLSTWYIRRSRDRFKSDDINDKQAALATTQDVLIELSKVMAPFMPFMAEQIWQRVTGNNFNDNQKSVHLEPWPVASGVPARFDSRSDSGGERETHNEIIEEMEKVRKIAEAGLAARDVAGFKIRQALQSYSTTITKELSEEMTTLVKDELNVLEIKFGKDELNTELTEELKLDGVRRELVRSINNLRKNAGLTISDRVAIYWSIDEADFAAPMAKQVFEKFGQEIKKDTLADSITHKHNQEVTQAKEVKVNGEMVWLGINKA